VGIPRRANLLPDRYAPQKPLTVASRDVTLRDFAIFQLKLVLDGGKDFFSFWASIVAVTLDFIAGRGGHADWSD
jgi:hypothetical protein